MYARWSSNILPKYLWVSKLNGLMILYCCFNSKTARLLVRYILSFLIWKKWEKFMLFVTNLHCSPLWLNPIDRWHFACSAVFWVRFSRDSQLPPRKSNQKWSPWMMFIWRVKNDWRCARSKGKNWFIYTRWSHSS